MESARERLIWFVAAEAERRPAPALGAVVTYLLGRHRKGLAAILYYGSCLRHDGELPDDAILDLYVIVDGYGRFYADWRKALANALLPPNVFYAEVPWQGRVLRVKYAVMSISGFGRGCSRRGFHPRLWARFSQPTRLIYRRDIAARDAVLRALGEAVATTAARAMPLLGPEFSADELWTRAFRESYRAELRPESAGRAGEIFAFGRDWFTRLTPFALAAAGAGVREVAPGRYAQDQFGVARQWGAKAAWALRRAVGKPMNILRLIKAVFTFEGGQSYLLWKVRRHAGISLEPTAWQQRHPLLAAPVLAWKLYRLGAFR